MIRYESAQGQPSRGGWTSVMNYIGSRRHLSFESAVPGLPIIIVSCILRSRCFLPPRSSCYWTSTATLFSWHRVSSHRADVPSFTYPVHLWKGNSHSKYIRSDAAKIGLEHVEVAVRSTRAAHTSNTCSGYPLGALPAWKLVWGYLEYCSLLRSMILLEPPKAVVMTMFGLDAYPFIF